ncbi:MAG: D-sedoheptulose 7-phosphate isomerase [Euryarchaeota archaeon]|nr:D-sedoheptulose 7-phosphate isomerase [Euryarchaeota archaeon]
MRGQRPRRPRGGRPDRNDVELVLAALQESARAKIDLSPQEAGRIALAASMMVAAFRQGRKVILFGNGGSAADAQHIAAELVGKFGRERPALAAIALSVNTSVITSISNDVEYKAVFARQMEAFAAPGDVAVAISTSGRSPSVLEGVRAARERGARTIGMTGLAGEPLRKVVDLCLTAPSHKTPRIQEVHITMGHIICELVENRLFG